MDNLGKMIEVLEDKLADRYTVITTCGSKQTEEQVPRSYVRLSTAQASYILQMLKEYRGLMFE